MWTHAPYDREYVAPFWYSYGRMKRSHAYNRRQWLPTVGGDVLHYLSLCNRLDRFLPLPGQSSGKARCASCDVLLLAMQEAGGITDDLPIVLEEVP